MNIYHIHDFNESEYNWNEVGRKKAKINNYIRWLIMIVNLVFLLIVAYLDFRYNLLEMNGFLCWSMAIVVLDWGLTICHASYIRKYACKMSLEERHDFNLYKYHHKYWKNPIMANQVLLNNAIILVKMRQYEQADQVLDAMHIEKCKAGEMKLIYFLRIIIASSKKDDGEIEKAKTRYTGITDSTGNYPDAELLENWIQIKDLEQMTTCLEQIKPVKKEHPGLAFAITIFMVYTWWFLGTAYGINRDAGYEIRYVFSAISLVIVNMGLFIILVGGIIRLHRHLHITAATWVQKIVKFIICTVLAIVGTLVLLINFLYIFLGLDYKETVTKKENGYTYLEVTWDNMGYNSYTEEYVTNNPFIMRKVYVPLKDEKDDTLKNEQPDQSSQGNTGNNDQTGSEAETDNADLGNEDTNADTENSGAQDNVIPDESDDRLRMRNGMQAVYNYLNKTKALENMEFTYSSTAKGEMYVIVSKGQESKDGNQVEVEYGLYYNKEKADSNGTYCDEYVLEKKYPSGAFDTQLVDFYLVNPDTLEVTDEHKTTW